MIWIPPCILWKIVQSWIYISSKYSVEAHEHFHSRDKRHLLIKLNTNINQKNIDHLQLQIINII